MQDQTKVNEEYKNTAHTYSAQSYWVLIGKIEGRNKQREEGLSPLTCKYHTELEGPRILGSVVALIFPLLTLKGNCYNYITGSLVALVFPQNSLVSPSDPSIQELDAQDLENGCVLLSRTPTHNIQSTGISVDHPYSSSIGSDSWPFGSIWKQFENFKVGQGSNYGHIFPRNLAIS